MHGRPRQGPDSTLSASSAVLRKRAAKTDRLRELLSCVLDSTADGCNESTIFENTRALLVKYPDVYTGWNLRRRLLLPVCEGKETQKRTVELVVQELKLTEDSLLENPKSYAAWHHRLWIMRKGMYSLEHELKLIDRFLEADARNFHAWRYRREILKLLSYSPTDDLNFTQILLERNFSNYSAWHARACVLSSLSTDNQVTSLDDLMKLDTKGQDLERRVLPAIDPEALADEYNLVENAIFTDPGDQSAFVYYRWLLGVSMKYLLAGSIQSNNLHSQEELSAFLTREIKRCQSLVEIEQEGHSSKWSMLTLASLMTSPQHTSSYPCCPDQRTLYHKLSTIDPLRRGFYLDAADFGGIL